MRSLTFGGTISAGSWLRLSVIKTRGAAVSLAITNQSSSATIADLLQQLSTLLNSSPDLQGSDGLLGQDLASSPFGGISFTLCARSPGYEAAELQVQLAGSDTLTFNPAGKVDLRENISDLQPRNHLYLTAGALTLGAAFSLDTTSLSDGFHQLTAVAYEGSHVRTQTRASLPVLVQNSALTAQLTLLDLPNTAPVQGTYHIRVAANMNDVSAIRLFSTGGLLDTITNQPAATFTISGTTLGVGRHPFYAEVQSGSGLKYRTQTRSVRLAP